MPRAEEVGVAAVAMDDEDGAGDWAEKGAVGHQTWAVPRASLSEAEIPHCKGHMTHHNDQADHHFLHQMAEGVHFRADHPCEAVVLEIQQDG